MSEEHRFYMQVYNLPQSEKAAIERLRKLREKSRRLGDNAIAERLSVVCDAWDREVEIEKIKAAQRGQENSMGVDHV